MTTEVKTVARCIMCKHDLRIVEEYGDRWLEDLDGMETCIDDRDGEYYPHVTNDYPPR
jgi:hypothetical protein